jgi:chemosensory pili system protein ChpA (sensor histidine kinase/response regulator)
LDEQIKVIGDLRIGIPLYNVYLNEADEWSRRLCTELTEWSLELDRPLPDAPSVLAHSLAGSSATVGFMALSELSRALEHALDHVQLSGLRWPEHARLFVESADDVRRLLHQFAAGFLKQPDPAYLVALKTLLETDLSSVTTAHLEREDAPVQDELLPEELAALAAACEAPLPDVAESPIEPEVVESEAAVDLDDLLPEVQLGAVFESLLTSTEEHAPKAPHVQSAHEPLVTDDEIEAKDVLDVDLFPIFEEEALELLPQLSAALRQWAARPENLGARQEALRVLHTLKGSARLAGAMRLGEMAHRMESAVERVDLSHPQAGAMDVLLTRLDGISDVFAALRATPAQALALPEAPLPKAVSEVTHAIAEPAVSVSVAPTSSVASMSPVLPLRRSAGQSIRVRSQLLDRMVNQAGEVMITRSRLESRLSQLRGSLDELTGNLDRLRHQLRDLELQSESQMQSRLAQTKETAQGFDPLEFDRFTRVQELTRMMAESVHDVATLQRSLQQTVAGVEDDLIAQARQTRELQRDLLRTRMVEFDSISERLYGVVRQAAKDADKQVRLDIEGGSLEMDRGVLDRAAAAFEHLLRNAVAHGIELPAQRKAAGKTPIGVISIALEQQSNDVAVTFSDDGAGLNLANIREKALARKQISDQDELSDEQIANLIFTSGLSTASEVNELSGRGIGMDVVRSEVNALGGRIELSTQSGHGTKFKLVLPLTTAVTQVVLLRMGDAVMGVPASLVELVRRVPDADLDRAYASHVFDYNGEAVPFYWAGALLQVSPVSTETRAKNSSVAIFRSAGRRVALHVDEVLGNQEVVVKNLGPQLARLPGLAGMSVLASGAVVLIYNPVALAATYGEVALTYAAQPVEASSGSVGALGQTLPGGVNQLPLVLVVDDSITVRRVTQRLLKREGFRVALASDGLHALEVLQGEKPSVVLTDIEMPRMDGFDLVRNIRGDERLRDLPIIMITSRIAEKHRDYARELKVDHYMGKPYPEDELITLVRQYCEAVVQA